MSLFEEMILIENQKTSKKEIEYTRSLINKTYNEWRKIRRRINAVDIISTTVNRLVKINPESVYLMDHERKFKIAVIIMRCLDNPYWKPIHEKQKVYKKLYPLMKKLENFSLNLESGGTLKEVIMTRVSTCIAMQDKRNAGKVIVTYEPRMPESYVRYLLGEKHKPEKIYKMQSLRLPESFETLIELLEIDLRKAFIKHQRT